MAQAFLTGNINARDSARVVSFNNANIANFNLSPVHPTTPDTTRPTDESFVSNVPQRKVDHYVDRPALRAQLETQLHREIERKTGQSVIAVLHGLGGAGKTQLVLDYIERHRDDYAGIFWIDATNKGSVERDMRVLYTTVHKLPMLQSTEKLTMDEILSHTRLWFSRKQDKWLLVFDAADDSDVDVRPLIPPSPSVHAIVTTRNSELKSIASTAGFEVSGLSSEQALSLFFASSGLTDLEMTEDQRTVVQDIAEELQCMALAVELAGSMISKEQMFRKADLHQYLANIKQNQQSLLKTQPGLASQYGKSILAAWETTYKAVWNQSQLAARLLGFLSFLDRTCITLELFQAALQADPAIYTRQKGLQRKLLKVKDVLYSQSQVYCYVDPRWIHALSGSKNITQDEVEAAFRTLTSYSLLRFDGGTQMFSMHKLIQDWAFERLVPAEQQQLCYNTVHFLTLFCFLRRAKSLELDVRKQLAAHMVKCCERLFAIFPSLPRKRQKTVLALIFGYSWFLKHMFWLQETKRLCEFQIHENRKVFVRWDKTTLGAMRLLVRVLYIQGQLEDAEQLQRGLCELCRQHFGEHAWTTIEEKLYLAFILDEQGNPRESIAIMRSLLRGFSSSNDPDHEKFFNVTGRLAQRLMRYNALEEAAETMFRHVIKFHTARSGQESTDTLAVRMDLGKLFYQQKRYVEAEQIQRENIASCVKVYGERHSKTCQARRHLGMVLVALNQPDEARSVLETAIEYSTQERGAEHLVTLLLFLSLSSALWKLGRRDEALPMLESTIHKLEHTSGVGNEMIQTFRDMLRNWESEHAAL